MAGELFCIRKIFIVSDVTHCRWPYIKPWHAPAVGWSATVRGSRNTTLIDSFACLCRVFFDDWKCYLLRLISSLLTSISGICTCDRTDAVSDSIEPMSIKAEWWLNELAAHCNWIKVTGRDWFRRRSVGSDWFAIDCRPIACPADPISLFIAPCGTERYLFVTRFNRCRSK